MLKSEFVCSFLAVFIFVFCNTVGMGEDWEEYYYLNTCAGCLYTFHRKGLYDWCYGSKSMFSTS